VLGEGGYGSVWLVKRISDGVLRAAKVISNSNCGRKTKCPIRSKRIPDEVMILETLEHPNIIHIHEAYYERNFWIIIMEYLPDFVDLFDHISKNGALSVKDAREVLTQLVDTCSYLISVEIDHRDIKAENVLYNPQTRRIRLIDFGCASLMPDIPYSTFRGTKLYLPPEYFNSGSYSALPAMTWSIGCLAYVLLNGGCPFSTKRKVAEHTRLRFINRRLDDETKEFLRDLLTVNVDNRMTPGEIIFHPWMGWVLRE
jgi:serine/threonine protein kinase